MSYDVVEKEACASAHEARKNLVELEGLGWGGHFYGECTDELATQHWDDSESLDQSLIESLIGGNCSNLGGIFDMFVGPVDPIRMVDCRSAGGTLWSSWDMLQAGLFGQGELDSQSRSVMSLRRAVGQFRVEYQVHYPTEAHIQRAVDLSSHFPPPHMFPTARGAINLEWGGKGFRAVLALAEDGAGRMTYATHNDEHDEQFAAMTEDSIKQVRVLLEGLFEQVSGI